MLKRHRRLIAALVVLVAAIAVGIAFGYLAGIALGLGALTLVLLGLGTAFGIDTDAKMGQRWGRGRWGSEDDSRGDR